MKTNCRSSILLHKGEDYLLITVNRAELLATVKRATTIAPPDSPLDVLKGVLLESDSARKMLTVTSTNLEIALVEKIPCSAQEDGALVYSARTLAEMLQRLPEDTVEISRKENRGRMTLTSGSVSYEVDVWDRGAFPKPDLPFPEDTVKVSGIPAVAQHTVFATAQDKDKPLLRCVNLMFTDAGLRAAGSNGMCIVTAKGDDQSTGDISLLVPALSLGKLAGMCKDEDEFRVGTTGKSIVFFKENFLFSARLMKGGYIDTNSLLKTIIEVKDGQTATLEITNRKACSILIHKVDANTGDGIYGVTFVIYDSGRNPIMEVTTDQDGYAYVDKELAAGKYYIRELEAADGYILDKQYKTVYVEAGKTSTIEWENTAVTGQIQITKYAAESNAITGQAGGVTLKGATFEIVRERSSKVVDYITTDARGVAASKPLPLGRYLIREVSAPAYYQVSAETFDVTLEYAGQIIKLAAYNKPAELGVTLTKTGIKEVLAGSKMSYRFTIANTSNVDLQNFYFHDKIPYDVTIVSALTTGTYNARLTYRILYKTNYNDYRVLASNLLSTNNYSFGLSGLQLMAGEVVTDIYFDFGTVPSGFQSVTKPTLMVSVNPRTANKYYVTNRADAGGKFGETWQSANASWITIVRNLTPVRKPLLPKTGY